MTKLTKAQEKRLEKEIGKLRILVKGKYYPIKDFWCYLSFKQHLADELARNTKEVVEEIESTLVELDIDTRARLPRPTVLKRNSWVSGKVFAINNITKNLYKKLNSLKKGK